MDHNGLLIILLIATGISLVMGLYMWFLHRNAPGVKGPVYWSIGNFLIGIGVMVRMISPPHIFWSMGGALLFITAGWFVYLAGIWDFKEKKIITWVVVGFPLLDVVQTVLFYYVFPSSQARIGMHLSILIVFSIWAIYEMLRIEKGQRFLKSVFQINAMSFGVFLVILIAGFIFNLNRPVDPKNISYIWMVAYGIAGGILTALTFGFLSAVNMQLYTELKGQLVTKTKFFSIIAHDLKGPVGTLMNFLNLLNNQKDLKEKQRIQFMENLEVLSQSTFHLLQNLLDWANSSGNIAQFDKAWVELNQLIDSNIQFFESLTLFKSIHLEFHYKEDVFINGNSKMIETVIRNLVSNAIKFTPKGGTITITTVKAGDTVRLVVEDTGVGIAPDRLEQIFKLESSQSTRGTNGESGSGLGLALCKEFITKNNGSIRVESQLEKGTRFIVEFPRVG